MIMTVVKTITDLERIGDEAEKIARMAKLIYQRDRPAHAAHRRDPAHVADIALEMLRKSLDAFARLDLAGCRRRWCARTSRWTRNSAPSCAS